MLQKLFALVDGSCQEDDADNLQHHDLLTPGHLLTLFIKVRMIVSVVPGVLARKLSTGI